MAVRRISLTKGKVARVDRADYERLSQWKWTAHEVRKGFWYATRKVLTFGGSKTIFMHREILGVRERNIRVDHRDGDGLNNTRRNLRPSTPQQNTWNMRPGGGSRSKFKGVHLHLPTGKWQARLGVNGRRISLGYFPSEHDAARAYDVAALAHAGEYARTNARSFPDEF